MPIKKESLKQLETTIGNMLRIGILTSALIISVGLFLYILFAGSGHLNQAYPTSLVAILGGIKRGSPSAILSLGLLLLILTPILRVVVSLYFFYRKKDYIYTMITLLVLIILLCSFFISKL